MVKKKTLLTTIWKSESESRTQPKNVNEECNASTQKKMIFMVLKTSE